MADLMPNFLASYEALLTTPLPLPSFGSAPTQEIAKEYPSGSFVPVICLVYRLYPSEAKRGGGPRADRAAVAMVAGGIEHDDARRRRQVPGGHGGGAGGLD